MYARCKSARRKLSETCAAGGGGAAAKVAAFVFAGAAPDATVLVGRHRKLETLLAHTAIGAHRARPHQHAQRLAGVAERKEQLGVGVAAIGVRPPGVVSGTECEALSKE